MYKLPCQVINRKCELDRHVSIKTVVLNGLLDSTSLDTRHNVPDFLWISKLSVFFQDQCKNVKS